MISYTPKSIIFATPGFNRAIPIILYAILSISPMIGAKYAAAQTVTGDQSSRRVIDSSDGRPLQILNNESPQAIIVGLPTASAAGSGRLMVSPNASLIPGESSLQMDIEGGTRRETVFNSDSSQLLLVSPFDYSGQANDVIPRGFSQINNQVGLTPAGLSASQIAHEPILGKVIERRVQPFSRLGALYHKIFGCEEGGGGIGRGRLRFAYFSIDSAQPQTAKSFQLGLDYGRRFVDRAEIYWRRIGGGGPIFPEDSVDAQDARIILENGGAKFSLTTVIPFRAVDPVVNPNHAGFSDMSVTTKTVLLDGNQLQLTQIFRSTFNTGSSSSGLGTGHISFEPGMLARYKFRPQTEMTSSLTYLFPVGSDPIASGQALRWAIGGAHTAIDTDSYALLTTLELTGWNVLNGTETIPNSFEFLSSDGVDITNLTTGFRWVVDNGGDLGLFEAGMATTFPLSSDQWFDSSLLFELRWSQ